MIDSASINRELDRIIEREGGYVFDPRDPGKETAFGITKATLVAYNKTHEHCNSSMCNDVSALGEQRARRIYRDVYIHESGFDNITDPRLFSLVVDSGVQHGTERATKWLQAALGVTADGVFGPVTRGRLDKLETHSTLGIERSYVYKRFIATRLRFYAEIIHNDHTQAAFALGWTNRMVPFIDELELP